MNAIRRLGGGMIAVAVLVAGGVPSAAHAQSSVFTYQGQLKRAAGAVTDMCDFQFGLFDLPVDGTQVGPASPTVTVNVSNGLFTAPLDFGFAAFNGDSRFLEIAVRCPAGTGSFVTLSPRQRLAPVPSALFAPPILRDADGAAVAGFGVLDDGGGAVFTYGPNGMLNVAVSSLADHPNNGFIGVYDDQGVAQAAVYVDENGKGQVMATGQKNFVVDHPDRPGTKIVYTSLEGPEAGIYQRGIVKLVHGRATIELPEHFVALANAESITVQLTPGSLDSQGLAFSTIHDGRIEIGELHKGKGSYEVHYVVHALRRGYENRPPVMAADEFRARFKTAAAAHSADHKSVAPAAGLAVSGVVAAGPHVVE